jgi:L-fucose isomerase-like protein
MRKPIIGIINVCMDVYPHDIADPILEEAMEELKKDCEVVYIGKAFTMSESIRKTKELLRSDPDLVVIFFSTWINASVPVSAIKEISDRPMFLWSIPMIEGMSTGSLVGFAVVKGTIERMGLDIPWAYGLPEEITEVLKKEAKASQIVRDLRRSRLGLIGYASMGMYTATFDHLSVKDKLGPEVVHIDNYYLVKKMEEIGIDKAEKRYEALVEKYPLAKDELKEPTLNSILMNIALEKIIEEFELDAITIKCQHEISRTIGCVCIPLSLIVEEGGVATCEGDIHGLITMMLIKGLTMRPSFFSDFINAEGKDIYFSSCGFIAPSLTTGDIRIEQQIHEIGEEGVVFSTAPKTGAVTIARLEAGKDKYRMHIAQGVVEEGYRRNHRGKPLFPICRVRLNYHSGDFLKNVVSNHYLLSYSDIKDDLLRICSMLDITPLTCD